MSHQKTIRQPLSWGLEDRINIEHLYIQAHLDHYGHLPLKDVTIMNDADLEANAIEIQCLSLIGKSAITGEAS
jgi:acetyltransferase-like isoleucine patch superfamily enzyme